MSEQITAEGMAKSLDDWASQSDPFNSEVRPTVGLSNEQLLEPIVMAAATFADFRMLGGSRSSNQEVPFVTLFGQAWEHLQYLESHHTECFTYWHEFAVHTKHHLVTAMLNDLLWTVRYQDQERPFEYAKRAIDHYLTLYDEVVKSEHEHKSLHMYDLLSRAVALASQINAAKDFHPKVAERCSAWLADRSSEDSFWAIRASACLPAQYRPFSLADRIESLHVSYTALTDTESWPLIASLYTIQLSMTEQDRDKERERQIRANASRLFIEEARSADSDLRASRFLQEAEDWVKGADEESALIGEIREVRSDLAYDDDFHEVSVEQSLPAEEIQRIANFARAADSMADALRFTAECGLEMLGAIDSIEETAEQVQNEPRLVNLISRVHIVHGNIECCRPDNDDAKRRRAIAELFRLQALTAANLVITPCLAAIGERPDSERANILQFMAASVAIGDFEAERFARALELYWEQDYDSAVHIAVPRIESSVRNLARKAGIEISFPPQGDECGGLRGLRPILDDLREVIGKSNTRMLKYLLVENHAMNLRDNYGHGVPSEDPRADAALVLWIVLWLAGLRPAEATTTQTSV